MRYFTKPMIVVLSIVCMTSAVHSNTAGFAWSDEARANTMLQHTGYVFVYVHYCGVCPRSNSMLRTQAKAVHDLIVEQQLNALLVIVTPDLGPEQLAHLRDSIGMTDALFAHDRVNRLRISTQNVWQVRSTLNGNPVNIELNPATFADSVKRMQTSQRLPVSNLKDPRAQQLWWQVERGHAGAMVALVRAAQRSAIKEEAAAILAVVERIYRDREMALVEADATIDTYEALEQLLAEAQGLRLESAQARYRALGRDPGLRDEIAARTVYKRIESEYAQHSNVSRQRQAPDAFGQLAVRYPDTKYGKLAAEHHRNATR